MIWVAVVAVDRDRGSGGGDNKNDGNGKGSGRNGANWEVGQIMETDGEGMMFDDGGTGMEVTLKVSAYEGNCLWFSLFLLGLGTGFLYYNMSTL
jgi:hypothetical protein